VLWKLPLSGHRAHGLTCCRLDPVANDPEPTSSNLVISDGGIGSEIDNGRGPRSCA
jgi:hypothetical protein